MADDRPWVLFERTIEKEAKLFHHPCIRVPETIRAIYEKRGIKVKSHVDFVMALQGRAVFFDAKVTIERLWNLKKYVLHEKRIHQWQQLLGHAMTCPAGYLIWFQDYKKIVWAPVVAIQWAITHGTPSIHPESKWVKSQPDDQFIDFRYLIFGEKSEEASHAGV